MEYAWGVPTSILRAVDRGQCMDLSYVNEMSPVAGMSLSQEMYGHYLNIDFGPASVPDIFSVIPQAGWQVVGDNYISVAEGVTQIIQVCQMLLG